MLASRMAGFVVVAWCAEAMRLDCAVQGTNERVGYTHSVRGALDATVESTGR